MRFFFPDEVRSGQMSGWEEVRGCSDWLLLGEGSQILDSQGQVLQNPSSSGEDRGDQCNYYWRGTGILRRRSDKAYIKRRLWDIWWDIWGGKWVRGTETWWGGLEYENVNQTQNQTDLNVDCQTAQKNTSWSSLFILNNNTYSTVKALPENKDFYTFRNQFKYLSQIRRMKGKICRCQLCKEKIKWFCKLWCPDLLAKWHIILIVLKLYTFK